MLFDKNSKILKTEMLSINQFLTKLSNVFYMRSTLFLMRFKTNKNGLKISIID